MIVDTAQIESLLGATLAPSKGNIRKILCKAKEARGITLEDTATLLNATGDGERALVRAAAAEVKTKVFGKRVVLFAPLYLTNYCTNGCIYCGFRSTNAGVERKALTTDEIISEARSLEGKGFKRLLLVLGEDARWPLSYIKDAVKAIYANTGIRIVHVNAPPMDTEELRELKSTGVGLFQVFQETYHRPTYEEVHPTGKKRDYDYRISVMDRALTAGFGDVGIGSLLGLYDWRFEVLATVAHSYHLYERFSAHAHTISIPRLKPALGSLMEDRTHIVTDDDMELIVSVYRLSVPSAGVVATTRESAELRARLIECGASQVSAASRTDPGGYNTKDGAGEETLKQFTTSDERSLDEVMASIAKSGHMPSLCTACYRVGRVGEDFTQITASGEMGHFCGANAILTLKEYLLDGRAGGSSPVFNGSIDDALSEVKDPAVKEELKKKFKELKDGKRDIFF